MPTHVRAGAVSRLALGLFLAASTAAADPKPFPHAGGYVSGFVPKAGAVDAAKSSYAFWKGKYLKTDCGDGMTRVDNSLGAAFSEGMGYGMVLTAYFADKTEFDGLWKFTQKNFNQNGLMGWHVTCSGFTQGDGGGASATDGDNDIGFALVVAVDQWGDAYKQPALDYLKRLKEHDYATCAPTGRVVATNGDWDKGCVSENTSYFTPAYSRVFARFTGDAFWSKAADDAVAIWQANANASTGLIANEVDQSGKLAATNPKDWVDYNGCRIPWRAALDYLWYGTAGSKQVTDKMTTWARTVGIDKLVDGYNTDGSPSSNGHYTGLNPWVGGWTSGAMTLDQGTLDTFYDYFKGVDNDNGVYYGASLRALYLLMLSGNQWEPAKGSPMPGGGGSGGATSGNGGGPAGIAGSASGGGSNGSAGVSTGHGGAGGNTPTVTGGAGSVDGGSGAALPGHTSGNCGCLLAGSSHSAPASMVLSASTLLALFRRRRPRRDA